MMTRNNKLLLGFAVIVLVPVVAVWYTAWPIIRAWDLPPVVSGHDVVPRERVLEADEVTQLNQWVQSHKTGWGAAGESKPGPAQRVVSLKARNGSDVIVSFWHFRHGDDVAGIQTSPQGPYRMRSYAPGELLPLIAPSQTP